MVVRAAVARPPHHHPGAHHRPLGRPGLRAHATQIDPASKFWFGLPDDEARTVHPWDDYRLEFSHVGPAVPVEAGFEADLFAGIEAGEAGAIIATTGEVAS